MSQRIGVGLISAGWMGTVHSRGYLTAPEKYPELGVAPELVIVADTVGATAQRAVDRLGYGRATSDYREVLADPAVDVVSICAPNYLHKEFALGAITDVSALTATFITERPQVAVGGFGHHVTAAAGAPMLPVENEDWAALMVRFASGAVGTFESSRVAIGPRCEYGIAVYGTEGSLVWDFERINEIQVCQRGETYGYA